MQNKLISIVLPVYNGEKYLAQAIESILKQTYRNIELIVVNDNSSDNTLNIVEGFAKNDTRVKIITNKTNQKLPESLNIGFDAAKGEYFSWTSDDNIYDISAIEQMVQYLETNQNDVGVCCDFYKLNTEINEKNVFKLNVSPQEMINGNCVGACFLYRSSIAEKIGKYDKDKFLVEDYDFWLKMMLQGNIGHIDRPLYTYRMHSNSLSGTRMPEIIEKTKKLQNDYLPLYKNKFKNISITNNKQKTKISFLEQIFSVKNNGNRKVIRILGIKTSIKRNFKKEKQINYLKKFKLAKKWIEKYTVENNGIAVESNQAETIYPEVMGYYIPTLLKWGDRERAVNYGNYLLTIQNEDGSWNEPSGKTAYTFDTGMILKGLTALIKNGLDENDKYKNALIKGADWILSMQRGDGSIATPNYDWWGLPFNKRVPESIHIYCLSPIRYAGKITNDTKYESFIKKALDFYLSMEDLTDFSTLSHFNAYIIEGLIDIGEIKRAQRSMDLISLHQRENGAVPAYSFVDFVCSTGLFQYAICWYKLGEIEKANQAFEYACSLQNKSGGWFGSYGKKANYFPKGEISWAVKYFLDAIYFGQKAIYEEIADIFIENIDEMDERYATIEKELNDEKYVDILDLGCGKARYTKNLIKKYPNKKFYCVDLSSKVLGYVKEKVEKKEGAILNIPYSDSAFDFVFVTEALEHAIDIDFAIKEISRVLKKDGKVVIIDKDKNALGRLQLEDFEQWFDKTELLKIMENNSLESRIKENLQYECKRDSLFNAWIGVKK